MTKQIIKYLLVLLITSSPVLFYSCCADEYCDEEDPYGKTIIKQTDTLYDKVPVIQRGPYYVQIGAFVNNSYADGFANDARSRLRTEIKIIKTKEGVYRILIGEFAELEKAEDVMRNARSSGYMDAFVRDEYGPIK